ncbi:MAG: metal-dependent hydrolase [Myxococcota bacterium]
MDNVTHGLIGYVLGRAAGSRLGPGAQEQPPEQDLAATHRARRALSWTGVLASNGPDLDLLITPFANDPKLVYLSHHRGHTHTLLLAVPLGLAIAALVCRLLRVEGRARRLALGLGALSALLHIGFDALNNYGVHPFFPLSGRWFYGDTLFIVEPLLLAVMLPLPLLGAGSRAGRVTAGVLAAVLLALVWGLAPVPLTKGTAVAVTALLALGLAVQRAFPDRAEPTLAAMALVVGTFALLSPVAEHRVRDALARGAPEERVLEVALAPGPGNPLCWNGFAVSAGPEDAYAVRTLELSLLPSVFAPGPCTAAPGARTAPLVPASIEGDAGLRFGQRFQGTGAELRALVRDYCEAEVFMNFARVPFWRPGNPPLLGDLRYDMEPEVSWAELELNDRCTDWFAEWEPPRQDVLTP